MVTPIKLFLIKKYINDIKQWFYIYKQFTYGLSNILLLVIPRSDLPLLYRSVPHMIDLLVISVFP